MTHMPRLDLLEDRIVLDGADPDVTILPPDDGIQLGDQDVEFTLTFDNTGTDSGYAPYVELIIPTSGGDGEGDGPSFSSASFLGGSIDTTVLTFDANGEVAHPFLTDALGDPLVVTGGAAGDTLVVFELPYGSFSPGNPQVEIDVLIDFSDQEDLGSMPTFSALGGFALGCDALDNPDTDPAVRGTATTLQVDPQLFEVTKASNAPEDEAATGPNYPYQYTLTVDVAPGQTIDSFTLTDNLPPEMVFLGNVNISGGTGGSVTTAPTVGAQVQPGDQLVVDFTSVSNTVTVTFDYYLSNDPSDSASPTNDPTTGAPTTVTNTVTGDGDWTPLDPDDTPLSVSDSDNHVLDASTLAIQKTNAVVVDNNATGPSTGDTYEFTLNIQVSDYFTFGNLMVEDILGDGWSFVPGSAEFFVVEQGSNLGSVATPLSLTANQTVSDDDPTAGSTRLTWDLSAAMTAAGGDGLLTGDIAGNPPGDTTTSGTPTTVTITYRATILDSYENPGSGQVNINQGDTLSNAVTVTGNVRDTINDGGDPTVPTANDVTETSASLVELPRGQIESKSVFALNGDTSPPTDVVIAAGDTVTFAVTYRAPLAAFENFRITDNLPQLVFDVASEFNPATTWVASPADRTAPPAAGTAYLGSGTSPALLGLVPTISTDGPNNGLTFDFGTFTETTPQDAVIEILFTTTVEDAIFAPDLFLTNQATAFETNTAGSEISSTAIAQFNYGEPDLNITKGVVATDSTDSEASITGPTGLSGVTAGDTGSPRFTGTVSSGTLDGAPLDVDADVQNVDAGDTVTFAIVIENEGTAPNGAFNVGITDTLPVGFEIPAGGLNLSITDGAGTPISYTRPDGTPASPEDLFTTGLELVDDGPLQGALSVFDETNGQNVVVITYDLTVSESSTPNSTLVNTAAVSTYSAFEGNGDPGSVGGPVNRVVTPLTDDASATTESIEISKTLDNREFDGQISNRGGNEIAVGEEFEFIVRVDVPEGTLYNMSISDRVTNGGMQILSATVETLGGNITSSTGVSPTDTATISGNAWSFDLGTVVNTGDNITSNDFIEIRVRAVAPDDSVGSFNHFMRNVATVEFDDAATGGDTFRDTDGAGARLIEPQLDLDKTVSPAVVDAGGTVSYSVEIDNPTTFRGAPAFDLTLSDVLHPQLTLNTAGIQLFVNNTLTAFDATTYVLTTNVGGDPNAFEIFIDELEEGDTIRVDYDATVSQTVAAGLTLPNTANLTFDSTPEDDSAADNDDRDYSLSDTEEVVTRAPGLDKSVVPGSTSYAETSGTDLGIGELVTYEFVVTIPEGSTDSVLLQDTLPAGMEYVSSQVVRIGDVVVPFGPADNISGSFLPAGGSGFNAGQDTFFIFGSLTNTFDGVTDSKDEIVVRLTARVTDVAAATDGATLTNSATLSFIDGQGNPASVTDTANVTVVEPDVSLAKSVSPAVADAGDTVTYTVTATNDGDGPAYDMVITDDVVGADVTAAGTATIVIQDSGGAPYTPTEAPSFAFDGSGQLRVVVPELPPGFSVVITYDATVEDTALFSSTYTNTASVARYDSNPAGDDTTAPTAPEEERTYTGPSATADLSTPGATLDKSFLSSNDSNTADPSGGSNAELNVGEEVVYELTISVPEGTADVNLVDTLPPGLLVQSAEVVAIGDDTNDSSTTLSAGDTDVSSSDITISAGRDSVTFDFGTVVVVGDDDAAAADTEIVVRVTAIVADVPAATDGATLTNTATLTLENPGTGTPLGTPVTATESVDIVEPDLVVDKTGPVGADQGEVVPYSISVTNQGTGPAYDAVITDTFADSNLLYQTGTAQVYLNGVLLAPQPTIVEPAPTATDGFQVQGLTLLPGDVIRVDFDVQIDAAAPEAESFVNTASVDYDSVDGSPVDADGMTLGRDDSASDNHSIATVPRIEKVPFASQFTETDSTTGSAPFELAIGEEVTFRYTITLPEIALDSVVATDTLPAGLEFVSANVVAVNGTGAAGTVTVTPNALDPQIITLDFGAMTNASDGSIGADDELVFEVVARVTNDGSASAGDTLTNSVDLDVDPTAGGPFGTQTTTADVEIVEPLLTVDKTGPLALSPGGPAGTFTITVTNQGVTGAEGPAYDLDLSDTLPAGMTLNIASLAFADQSGNPLTPETLTATGTGFLAEFPLLDVGDSIVITYDASLDAGEGPLTTYENTASADYFSAPDDLVDGGGAPVAEDYTPVTDTHLVSTVPTLDKDAVSTGTAETPDDADTDTTLDVAIGETVTYEFTLTLPEIPMDTVALTDTLPSGLSFVDAEVVGIGSEITVGGSTDVATIDAGATVSTVGQAVTVSLANVVNTYVDGTIDAGEDTITIRITARVDDDPANIGTLPNTHLTNNASLVVTPQGETALTAATATETIEVVEPNLTLAKTGDVAVNPGDDVDYTLTIVNDGTAPAFDLIVGDTMGDPFLSLVSGSVQIFVDGVDRTADVTVTETGDGFTFELDDMTTGNPIPLNPGSTLLVTYSATLDVNAPEARSFVNTASVDYDGLPGDPLDENGLPVDDRDYTVTDDNSVATVPFLTKTPTASNFTETDSGVGSDPFELAIGEEVTFSYDLYLPEIDMDSVVFEDALPPGLEFVRVDSVTYGTGMTDTNGDPLAAPTVTVVNPQSVFLDFGDIRNPEDTAPPTIGADDVITVQLTARVTNDGVPSAGDTLTNQASLEVNPTAGSPLTPATATADVLVVEPDLSVTKTGPIAASPGDSVAFSVDVENSGVPGATGPAYDVSIVDVLPAGFSLDSGSIAITLNGSTYTPGAGELTATTSGFTLTFDVLMPDDQVEIDYTATLSTSAAPVTDYTNTATVNYDSAPGDPVDGDGNPVEETYTPEVATHTVATIPTLDKTAIGSQFPETAEDADTDGIRDLQIGETVTYELVMTLPEIPMETVTLTDALPAGLSLVSSSVTEIGGFISVDGSTDLATINAGATVTTSGQTLTIQLDDVVNADTTGTGTRANDAIVIQIVARVDDITTNTAFPAATQLTNTAGLIIDPDGAVGPLTEVTDTETVEIVEPRLVLDKTGEVAGDPGAPVDYAISVENTGTGTAFDVDITDALASADLTLVPGSVEVFLNGIALVPQPTITTPASGGTDGFTVSLASIAPGDEVRVDFSATISADAPVAEVIQNTATVDYDSAPGDPVDESGDPVGRTGTDTDDHGVANGPGLVKTAHTSQFSETDSEAGSDPFEVTNGETVTYRYEITLPELQLDSVVLTDTLPAGVSYVSSAIVNVNGTGASGVVSVTPDGSNPNIITFDFGSMTNASDGSIGADDVLVFDVTVRVLSDGSNAAGDVLTNTASLAVDPAGDDPFAPVTDAADITVVEPQLQIDKTGPAAVDPFDVATFTLTITNVGDPAGPGPAFDIAVGDDLPPELTLDPTSLTYRIDGVAVSPTSVTATGTGFDAVFDLLNAGSVLTITYDATLSADAPRVDSFVNTATVSYDGVPGDPVDESGDPVGESYTPVSDDHVVSTGPTLTKTPVSTGFSETPADGDGDGILGLSVGETITYDLVLTLPEIAMDSVVLRDVLPTGLTFVSGSVVTVGSEITIGASSVTNSGQTMTVTLTDVVNSYVDGTITAAQDDVTVRVVARLADIPANVDATQLTNTADLTVTPQGGVPLDTVVDTATVEVIEPKVTVTKTTNDPEPQVGDTFTYTLVITNDSTATSPAFNSVLTDKLPFELTLTGVITLSDPTLASVSPTSIAGTDTLIVTVPVLQPGQSLTVDVEVFVGFLTDVITPTVNTAEVVTGSTPIANDPNARSYSDDDDAVIVPQPVVDDEDDRKTNAIAGIDDARFLPVLLIDPIFTGTAEPGSNVTINLYRQDGSLDYVRHIMADTGGHWIAIFPRVQLHDVQDDFHEEFATSVLFDAPVRLLDGIGQDSLGFREFQRELSVGSNLLDEAYTLGLTVDRPSTLPQDQGIHNSRTFFAPAHIGEIYGRQDVLNLDEVFQNIAFRTVEEMYESSTDPLGISLNRFNYEFLSSQTAVPGQQ